MRDKSSFRDPDAYIFWNESQVYRYIQESFKPHFIEFLDSELYSQLVSAGYILEVEIPSDQDLLLNLVNEIDGLVVRQSTLRNLSYPSEWIFEQLHDAATLTLKVQILSIQHGYTLKDASAYNVMFDKGKPLFIDVASFIKIPIQGPWVGYGQFCRHFLASLAIRAKVDPRLSVLHQNFIDGVPLDLAVRLIPLRKRFGRGVRFHVWLHSVFVQRLAHTKYAQNKSDVEKNFNKIKYELLAKSLMKSVQSLRPPNRETEWRNYRNENSYSPDMFLAKNLWIKCQYELLSPQSVMDLGGNDGFFTEELAESNVHVIVVDKDEGALSRIYQKHTGAGEIDLLVCNLNNPTPGFGWNNFERSSFSSRFEVDLLLAMALVHHLYFTEMVSFREMAKYLSGMTSHLLIEFIEVTDEQVQRLGNFVESRQVAYTRSNFEAEFTKFFTIENTLILPGSTRILYRMEPRSRSKEE